MRSLSMPLRITLLAVLAMIICVVESREENVHSMIFKNLLEKGTPKKEVFKMFHALNKKEYDLNSEEGVRRYRIFKKSLEEIERHNSREGVEYMLGITSVADWTDEELHPQGIMEVEGTPAKITKESIEQQGTPINWVEAGAFSSTFHTLVSGCSTYGHLSAAAAMEAAYFIKHGQAKSFSPQSLLDCAHSCNQFLNYIDNDKYVQINRVGIYESTAYPWKGAVGPCLTTNAIKHSYRHWDRLFYAYTSTTVSDAVALLNRGPYIFRASFTLPRLYTGGIFTPTSSPIYSCGSYYYPLLVVGYGIDSSTGKDYWIVRGVNGVNWGEKGYIRLPRNDVLVNWGITCNYGRPQL